MEIALSLVVLTTIALVLGSIALFRRGGHQKQAWLMLLLAAIMAGNVAIWAMPDRDGQSMMGKPLPEAGK